jgi:hypothetical protein
VIPPASSKHPSVKSRDHQDDIHASLCCCTCNMRREARRSTPGRACFLSTRRYPLGTHLGLRHLKPYNQACSPCGDTNASQRNSMLRTSRCRLRCFMTTIIPGLVEHGGQPFIALPSMERDHIASLSMGSDHLPRQAWSDHIASLSLGQQSTAWSDPLPR